MGIRTFSINHTVVTFMHGAAAAMIPPLGLQSPGNQPHDEKVLGFPSILAFRVEYSQQPITPLTEPADELVQP